MLVDFGFLASIWYIGITCLDLVWCLGIIVSKYSYICFIYVVFMKTSSSPLFKFTQHMKLMGYK